MSRGTPRPDRCTECKRKVRGSSSTALSEPGTVAYGAHGLCNTCWRHATGKTKAPTKRLAYFPSFVDLDGETETLVRRLVARRGCPEVLDILGLGQAS